MLLLVNVDDLSGEAIPHVIEGLMARGAKSAHVVQAITKKGRLEFLFFIDAPQKCVEALGGFLASELGTLGIRVFDPDHIRFEYQVQHMRLTAQNGRGPVQTSVRTKKVLDQAGKVISVKAEYEDLRLALAQFQQAGVDVSFATLKGLVEQTALGQEHRTLGHIRAEHLDGAQ